MSKRASHDKKNHNGDANIRDLLIITKFYVIILINNDEK